MSEIEILLVDGDELSRASITRDLTRSGFRVAAVPGSMDARLRLEQQAFQVAILDLHLPDRSGLDLLADIRELWPDTDVLVLSDRSTMEEAIRAMKLGAADFLRKPPRAGEIESALEEALRRRRAREERAALQREVDRLQGEPRLVGVSSAIRGLLDLVVRVAETDCTVLVRGESGVGKELVARAVHRGSRRARQPFVVVDCASLHENLLQNELFGHERGAYTGAARMKRGLFEVADGGTIFLDEIAEVTPPLQTKVLRVLETGTFRRVGGTSEVRVDVRVIAATNRLLEPMLEHGQFREDLYYRLNVFSLQIPPLRDRREDIPPLVEHFVRHSPIAAKRGISVSAAAMEALRRYAWPGNVRELRNVIERAMILCDGDSIEPVQLPIGVRHSPAFPDPGPTDRLPTLEEVERRYIRRVLEECRGHRQRAAFILGISERNLYRKLKELDGPSVPDAPAGILGSGEAVREPQPANLS